MQELRFNNPVNNFQSCQDRAIAFWVLTNIMVSMVSLCLAQGCNAAQVGFKQEPAGCFTTRTLNLNMGYLTTDLNMELSLKHGFEYGIFDSA